MLPFDINRTTMVVRFCHIGASSFRDAEWLPSAGATVANPRLFISFVFDAIGIFPSLQCYFTEKVAYNGKV